jgi:hypothetical protein
MLGPQEAISPSQKSFEEIPRIGDPGADKILLFARSYPVMGLDSRVAGVSSSRFG